MEVAAAISGFVVQWASAFWMTLRDTGPFLVFGLVLAGVLHVMVPARIILWALGQGGWRGALRGALIGTPLPLCSCGVVPTAFALRRQGASLSATTAFTISTPETSIDAVAVTAALLPSIYIGVRPVAAVFLAFAVGIVVEFFAKNTREDLRMNVIKLARAIHLAQPDCPADCAQEGSAPPSNAKEERLSGGLTKLKAVVEYAFGTFFRDIATWLIVGLAAAALLQVVIPVGGLSQSWIGKHAVVQVFLAILIGIPLYSCATATTPLVAVLLAKGVDPGAALALLLAGPATNVANVFTLKRELGGRVTFVYYAALFVFCFVLGMTFSLTWPVIERVPALTSMTNPGGLDWLAHGLPGWIEVLSAWLLTLLTLKVWGASLLAGRAQDSVHEH